MLSVLTFNLINALFSVDHRNGRDLTLRRKLRLGTWRNYIKTSIIT